MYIESRRGTARDVFENISYGGCVAIRNVINITQFRFYNLLELLKINIDKATVHVNGGHPTWKSSSRATAFK